MALYNELVQNLQGAKKQIWAAFLQNAGIQPDEQVQTTALIWEDDVLVATGSRQDNILKCIAVDPAHQGTGLTATIMTLLQQDAFNAGYDHLFLYTKPENVALFAPFFFYPIAATEKVLLMENKQNGIASFLESLSPATTGKTVGAAVMNCNPFTKGHRYLIETAAAECDWVYVFVLSEDKSEFSTADRMEMVKLGTQDLKNVTVLPTGPYLISSATFPTYFLKDRDHIPQAQCLLDVEIFTRYYAPKFGITRRYVGTEPFSQMTAEYNRVLADRLPEKGIELRQIDRLKADTVPVSASALRKELQNKALLQSYLPKTTLDYLTNHNLL